MAKQICRLSAAEIQTLKDLTQAHEDAREDLGEFLDNVVARFQDEIEERSEKWRESESGREAQDRLETIGGWRDDLSAAEIEIDVAQLEGAQPAASASA
jgi:hypothetical protein